MGSLEQMLFRRGWQRLRDGRWWARLERLAVLGWQVTCPCCGSSFRHFKAYNGPDRVCWDCGAMERHRSLWLYMDRHPELFRPGMSVLHVAPEPVLRNRLAQVPDVRYVGGDLTGEFGPERIDVTQLEFDDASFDAVMCNHVLEHVPDDRLAMQEIARVLKPGGWALLQVPDVEATQTDEDPRVTDPAERERRFGQHDHVRRYGWDYVRRLEDAGLSVVVERQEHEIPARIVEQCRLRKFGEVEPIFICHR